MTTSLNKETLIPSGSDLRVLLNSDHISYGEVQNTLKEKGIFVGNSDKAITVPILSATLLRPDEFVKLIDASIDRESRPKVKVSTLDLVAPTADWVAALRAGSLFGNDFNPGSDISGGSVQFIQSPNLVIESKDKVLIQYSIARKDFSKDWIERELNFDGQISVEKNGSSLRLDFASTHSSRETEAINKRISSRIAKVLNEAKISSSDARMITFGGFQNVERVRFFKRLTSGLGKQITLGSVNDMEISRDVLAGPLPNDPQVAWMNQTVKRLKIDGERLNDIFLISEEKYYPFYCVLRMDITYQYEIGVNKGVCRTGFAFSNPSRAEETRKDAELTIDFVKVTHEKTVNGEARRDIMLALERGVRALVEQQYDRVLSERPKA